MEKSESIKQLSAALSKLQGELIDAPKSSENPFFKSKYADLSEVLKVIRPLLCKHGLSVIQSPSLLDSNVVVETMLAHSSGEYVSSSLTVPVGKKDAQAVGSAITYGRRYSLSAIMGITQADDDGNAAVAKEEPKSIKNASKKPLPDTITGERSEIMRELWDMFSKKDIKTPHIKQIIHALFPNGPHTSTEMSREQLVELYRFIIGRTPDEMERELKIKFKEVQNESK